MASPADNWLRGDLPPWSNPPLQHRPILGDRYTSTDFYRREWENLWPKTWLLLGREADMRRPGDYQMEEVGPESFIMIRQDDGSIRAFYNVCQHRGSRLLFKNEGWTRDIVCPYHGWQYRRDGVLRAVKDPEDFPRGDPCGRVRLVEARCETFAGFVWVNMDDRCVSLREYLGPVWDDFAMYQADDWVRVSAATVNTPCNWKVPQDNSCESYHLPAVHPQIKPWVEEAYQDCQFDWCEEGHNRMRISMGIPSRSLTGNDLRIHESLAAMLRPWGLDPKDFEGREFETREALQAVKRKLGPARGFGYFDNLRDDQLTDAYHYNIFPNVTISFSSGESILLQRMRPHRRDPEQHHYDNFTYVAPAAAAQSRGHEPTPYVVHSVDEQSTRKPVPRRTFDYGTDTLGQPISDQDLSITAGQQLGLASRAYGGVLLASQEDRVQRFHDVIDEYLDGKRP